MISALANLEQVSFCWHQLSVIILLSSVLSYSHSFLIHRHFRRWLLQYLEFTSKLVYCTIDGTGCLTIEPHLFSSAWCSHEMHGPSVRLRDGVFVKGSIVWGNGPFPCGSHPDLKIFNPGLERLLWYYEALAVEKRYKGSKLFNSGHVSRLQCKLHKRLCARLQPVGFSRYFVCDSSSLAWFEQKSVVFSCCCADSWNLY